MRFFLIAILLLAGTLRAETLAEVLARMDRAAAGFQSLSARMKRSDHTAVIKDTSVSAGTLRLKRIGGQTAGLIEFSEPDPRFVELRDRKVTVFYPKANTAEIYDVGKRGEQLDQFILLGFGTTSAELKKNYEVKLAGSESAAGVKASKLELIPKSGEARKHLDKIELWIPEDAGHAVQEKLYQKSKDWNLIVYSDVKVNPPLADADLRLKLPANVQKIHANK